jgi:tetratricopeptide (TPR) repeat protein
VKGLRAWFGALPAPARWAILSAGALLLLVLIGSGAWSWHGRREAAAQHAVGAVIVTVQRAVASNQPSELEAAAKAINEFLASHSGTRAGQQGFYLLGQVEFQRRQWDAAAAAFGEAARRDAGSIGLLSRLGQGQAYEAKGDPARAVEAYQQALSGRGPKDFLYGFSPRPAPRSRRRTRAGRSRPTSSTSRTFRRPIGCRTCGSAWRCSAAPAERAPDPSPARPHAARPADAQGALPRRRAAAPAPRRGWAAAPRMEAGVAAPGAAMRQGDRIPLIGH